MKKTLALLVVIILLVGTLCSCFGKFGSNVTGTRAAKLLLADERLNATLLKDSENIFEKGTQVYSSLIEIAQKNLANTVYVGSNANGSNNGSNVKVDLSKNTSYEKFECADGSYVEVNGELYKWKNFDEYSNSYDYFLNLTTNIIKSATMGAELIDNVKKNVKDVDKWVKPMFESREYYLHVEENREVLYSRSDGQVEMCTRYKTDDGINVYELSIHNEIGSTRMTYIPGKLCEFSYNSLTNDYSHNFRAQNTRGYWEVVDVGPADNHYNVSCMVMKDDICYDAFYDPKSAYSETEPISLLKVISPDRNTDLLNISEYSPNHSSTITLALQAFTGYEHIEAIVPADKIGTDVYDEDAYVIPIIEANTNTKNFILTYRADPALVLSNGTKIRTDDTFINGNVEIRTIRVSYTGKEPIDRVTGLYGNGYVPELELIVYGETYEERMNTLKQFLTTTGLTCKYDFEYILNGISRAYTELEEIVKYQEWNGYSIYTEESLDKGNQKNIELHEQVFKNYDAIKDAEVVNIDIASLIPTSIQFPTITAMTVGGATVNGLTGTINDISLTINDTTLLEEGTEYAIYFAFLNPSSGLTHIPTNSPRTIYNGEDSFTITAESVRFDIPTLEVGEYVLVAYIATAEEGIRVCLQKAVPFTEIDPTELHDKDLIMTTSASANKELILKCTKTNDIKIWIYDLIISYDDLYERFSEEGYKYGFVSDGAKIERLNDNGEWVALNGDETEIPNGEYRLSYNIVNGDKITSGYLIAEYFNYSSSIIP